MERYLWNRQTGTRFWCPRQCCPALKPSQNSTKFARVFLTKISSILMPVCAALSSRLTCQEIEHKFFVFFQKQKLFTAQTQPEMSKRQRSYGQFLNCPLPTPLRAKFQNRPRNRGEDKPDTLYPAVKCLRCRANVKYGGRLTAA